MARANMLVAIGPVLAAFAVAAAATPRPAVYPPPVAGQPFACFAAKGCPGTHAAICFAGRLTSAEKSPCPRGNGRYRFARTPPPR